MKLNNLKKQAGLTLIEVTLVIAVLLGLISVLFIGVSAYKEGSNRSKCILNISNVQKAVRSYQNLYEVNNGAALAMATIAGTCPPRGGDISLMPEISAEFSTRFNESSNPTSIVAGGNRSQPVSFAYG